MIGLEWKLDLQSCSSANQIASLDRYCTKIYIHFLFTVKHESNSQPSIVCLKTTVNIFREIIFLPSIGIKYSLKSPAYSLPQLRPRDLRDRIGTILVSLQPSGHFDHEFTSFPFPTSHHPSHSAFSCASQASVAVTTGTPFHAHHRRLAGGEQSRKGNATPPYRRSVQP